MRILVVIDSPPSATYHRATVDALFHASDALGQELDVATRTSDMLDNSELRDVQGIVIGPGSPYRREVAVWNTVRCALACSLDGKTIDVELISGSRLAALHGDAASTIELTTCNYGLDPARQNVASTGGMIVAGVDDTGEVRAIERSDHPFFVASLYQPQLRSAPDAPHPVFVGLVTACAERRGIA